jgi:hypothetical protein
VVSQEEMPPDAMIENKGCRMYDIRYCPCRIVQSPLIRGPYTKASADIFFGGSFSAVVIAQADVPILAELNFCLTKKAGCGILSVNCQQIKQGGRMKALGIVIITVLFIIFLSSLSLLAQMPELPMESNSHMDLPNMATECLWFDSLNVRFVGNWPFGYSYAVTYDETRSLAFCGSGGGVYILDVSTPSSPVKLSEGIHTRDFVNGLFYDSSSQRLYIADDIDGLEIWDVSMPASPMKFGYCDTPSYAMDVYVSGSYAYVADYYSGLRIIDVIDPSNPSEVGYYDTPGHALGVYVSSSYAYVADYYGGLRIIDVIDPSNPYEAGYYCYMSAKSGHIHVFFVDTSQVVPS